MKTYKTFFIKTLILMIIIPILITAISLFVSNYFVGKEIIRYGESQMIHQWFSQKKSIAQLLSKRGAKIVFLSGSNSLFGINAEKIEKKTGIPILNYASHAGLSSYIFYDAKRILKKGDTVFLPLEYSFYMESEEIDSLPTTLVEYTISYDNDYYKQLPIKSKLKILMYLVKLDSFTAIGKTIDRQYKLSPRGDVFDAVGVEKNYAKTAKPREFIAGKLSKNYKKWELYKFIKWCKENGIKVYAFAPNVYHSANATKEELSSYNEIKKFYKLAGVKFIGNFEDGFFDINYIYNTVYHLNQKGQEIRSDYFIKKIKHMEL